MRALGLDLGSRRIGVAVSDRDGRVATPCEVVPRTKDAQQHRRKIAELVGEFEAEVVVVGLPISLDGTEGPAVREVRTEIEHLTPFVKVPVETYDERFTTVTAHDQLAAAAVPGRKRRQMIDQVAAAVMLQAWLDAQVAADREGGQ
ncbi:MAG: Holliday junction resolvase RuvX [Actinomycetota bacterium]|nr:Holliday junction resolvase RuvX [Actinomycetota bacterium]